MKLTPPVKLKDFAAVIKAKYVGDANHFVLGINEIHRVEVGDLTFVDIEKYYKKALNSKATTILINKEVEVPKGKALVISDDPFRDYNLLTEHYQPEPDISAFAKPILKGKVSIGQHCVFGENVTLENGVAIGHNVVIGKDVTIGENTTIHANVTICDNAIIGKSVEIQSGAVIGSDAFYYKKRPNGRDKMLSKGSVIIEDFVEIGANTTIDKGVSADTIIGEYTKIDNLCQIGHDTIIGKRCVLAAQVGIAGVSKIGNDVILWGQVGIVSDVEIGDGAIVYGKTGIMSSVEGGKGYLGFVGKDAKKALREIASLEKLTELLPKIERFFEAH